MNEYQTTLWNDLNYLVENNEAFYFQDYEQDGHTYRIFNYRLASYTDFLQPSALECRGIMFRTTGANSPELSSLPMPKFFNLNENPMTMNLDLSTMVSAEDKADGSLISTYMHNGQLMLKSKGSLSSEQALDSMEWLNRPEQMAFKLALTAMFNNGFTVNMEWTAPFNRIVISYAKPALTILNIRYHATGEYVNLDTCRDAGPNIAEILEQYWIQTHDVAEINDLYGSPEKFVDKIPDMTATEGYIIKLASGQSIKIKTHWYLTQHRAKDSINSDRRLFETVVADSHDDLRSMFHDNQDVLDRIQWMEDLVGAEYNHMVNTVEAFYQKNKRLERKNYAIKAKDEVKPLWFGLCMSRYLEKPVDYRSFMMSKWKEYGIKDQLKGEV